MQALGLIETRGLLAAVESADTMLKSADVSILEKTYVGGGLVSVAVTGDVGAVKAAVEAGAAAVKKLDSALLISEHVIPRPHDDLNNIFGTKTQLESLENISSIEEEEEENIDDDDQKSTVMNLVTEDSKPEDLQVENEDDVLEIDLNSLHKVNVDRLATENGIDKTIEVLTKIKVVKLRKLAREYKGFGITGKGISKANKNLLITKFRAYYEEL